MHRIIQEEFRKIDVEEPTRTSVGSSVVMFTSASYDDVEGILVVNFKAYTLVGDAYATPAVPEKERRVAEFVETQPKAVRRAAALIDEWYGFHESWAKGKTLLLRNPGP